MIGRASGPAPRCLYCGQPATRRHHFTRRDGAGRYLDPDLVAWLCGADHGLEHQMWRHLGLDQIDDPTDARLRRLSFVFVRLGHHEVAVSPLMWRELTACLFAIRESLAPR